MSEELYEIAFSGQIVDGADLETVKRHIASIFKADEKRLQQLFSGRRVLIKREVDAATMAKYRGAFQKAGAICEVRTLVDPVSDQAEPPPPQSSPTNAQPADAESETYQSRYPESDQVPQALLSDPLGINGEQIEALQADIAPVGSQMQHQIKEVPDAQFDLNGLDVAPVGSTLSTADEEPPPPPPDTRGLTMAD